MSSTFAQQKRNLLKTTFLREEPLFRRHPLAADLQGLVRKGLSSTSHLLQMEKQEDEPGSPDREQFCV